MVVRTYVLVCNSCIPRGSPICQFDKSVCIIYCEWTYNGHVTSVVHCGLFYTSVLLIFYGHVLPTILL